MKRSQSAAMQCVIVLVLGSAICISQAQDLAPEILHYADIVFHDGQVLTMDQDRPPFATTEALSVFFLVVIPKTTLPVNYGLCGLLR